ncbi:hypothetical protein EGH62_24170 [Klebsiella aerogenes]|nr:hypothetical protein EGH62_24170 [Klebsiella aerogenes]
MALRLPGLQTRSPEKVRSTASGESRCHSNVNERLSRKTGPFVFVFCGQTRRHLPRWRYAYRGYRPRSPEKVRSTASGESRCHSNVNERLSRKTGPFVFVFCGQTHRHLPRWRCAYRVYKNRGPEKVRSTASGKIPHPIPKLDTERLKSPVSCYYPLRILLKQERTRDHLIYLVV